MNSQINPAQFSGRPIPYITREEMRELDRRAIEEYHIPSLILMENAGRGAAQIILEKIRQGPVAILCGRGNNGGDGFVIARHISNYGIPVQVYFTGKLSEIPPESDPGINLKILRAMGLTPLEILDVHALKLYQEQMRHAEIVVDALFGTGLQGEIREPVLRIMEELKSWNIPSIAVDIPSGLDANTGAILGTILPAVLTITFGLPKIGFLHAQQWTGPIVIVDISIPNKLLQQYYRTIQQ